MKPETLRAIGCTHTADLIDSGCVRVTNDGHYMGRASDGKEVIVGTVGRETVMERYFRDYPKPTDW